MTLRGIALLILLSAAVPLGAQIVDRPDADPRIQKLVAAVSEERLLQLDEKLTSFVTRNTLSDTTSPVRGVGAARQSRPMVTKAL